MERLKDKTQQSFQQVLWRILSRCQSLGGGLIGEQRVSKHRGETPGVVQIKCQGGLLQRRKVEIKEAALICRGVIAGKIFSPLQLY